MPDIDKVQSETQFRIPQIQAQYNRVLLQEVTPMVWTDRFAQSITIEQNGGTDVGIAQRFKNILPATTPLGEITAGTTRHGNKVASEKVRYKIDKYGDFVIVTEENELYNLVKIRQKYQSLQSRQAAVTASEIVKDKLFNGTNVIYADGATSRVEAADKNLTQDNIDLAVTMLFNQGGEMFTKVISGTTAIGTRPIAAGFIGVAHTSVLMDLKKLPSFTPVKDYPNQGAILPNEAGSTDDVRWIRDTEGRYVTEGGKRIYQSLIFAKNAYAQISLRGSKNLEVMIHDKKAVGGPLEEYSTIGWKFFMGAVITNENWLIRLESGARIEDSTQKHYYDYS